MARGPIQHGALLRRQHATSTASICPQRGQGARRTRQRVAHDEFDLAGWFADPGARSPRATARRTAAGGPLRQRTMASTQPGWQGRSRQRSIPPRRCNSTRPRSRVDPRPAGPALHAPRLGGWWGGGLRRDRCRQPHDQETRDEPNLDAANRHGHSRCVLVVPPVRECPLVRWARAAPRRTGSPPPR